MLVAGLALVLSRISGSSIGVLSATQPVAGLLWGTPRSVRSDEYLLVTPSRLSSTLQGFPANPWVGLAPTDLEVAVHSGVSTEWTALLHPDSWGFVLGGADVGLAFSWWWSFVISLLGVYAFVGLITRMSTLSALVAIAATFTPYSAWWSAAPPSLLLGYAAAAGACFLACWRARTVWAASFAAVGAGLLGAMLALVLYPPWAISLGIVVALTCLGCQFDERHGWRRIGWTFGLAIVVAGLILAVWWGQNAAAIAAMTGTHYPGSRVTRAGDMALYQLLNAPLNFWTAGPAGDTIGVAGEFANLSGVASSWMPLPVVALLLAGAVELTVYRVLAWRTVHRSEQGSVPRPARPRLLWTFLGAGAASVLLLAWSIAPVPDWIGAVTLLNKVQASRTPLALGFAVILMVALAAAMRRTVLVRAWTVPWAVAAGFATAATSVWAQYRMPWDASLVSTPAVLASGFLLGAAMALVFCVRRPEIWAGALAVYAIASWAVVNPVQQGTAPLSDDPLTVALRDVTAGTGNPRAAVFSDFRAVAMVRAAGLQSVSGQTPIPDAGVMNELAPADELLWNNYVKYLWTPLPAGSETRLTTIVGSTLKLEIDPCSVDMLSAVRPGWAVSNEPLDATCWSEVALAPRPDGGSFYISRATG